jgi:hypothetical protein
MTSVINLMTKVSLQFGSRGGFAFPIIVELFSATGHLVNREELCRLNAKIVISECAKAMYFFRIVSKNGRVRSGRLVKQ